MVLTMTRMARNAGAIFFGFFLLPAAFVDVLEGGHYMPFSGAAILVGWIAALAGIAWLTGIVSAPPGSRRHNN
ncbi:MAG: hypothetical protein K2X49_02245 [Acetobacteraceae bacterium]|nr:hypothetical protein [Acetobacteraceae bacterium]